jgi:hypothetical protein
MENQLKHIVLFKFKLSTTDEQIRQVTDAFRAIKNNIPGIVSFEQGPNTSLEGRNLGFNYVYILTFTDAAARDAYLPHPAHQKFGEFLGQVDVVEDVFVVDYLPQN